MSRQLIKELPSWMMAFFTKESVITGHLSPLNPVALSQIRTIEIAD
ncbi:MAG: hypothetical protein V3U39_11370 [Acidimicrobiia bacterium]|jgi:hypothetical protein